MRQDHPAGFNWTHLGLLVATATLAAAAHAGRWPPLLTLAGGLMLTMAWLMIGERRAAYRHYWLPSPADLRRDAGFLGANVLADGLGDAVLRGVALVAALWWPLPGPAQALPLPLAALAALLVAELGDYAFHRASHRGGWLWQVHAVHHSLPALNTSNNLTTHPVGVLLRKLVRLLPLWLLGLPAEAVLLAALFAQAQSFAAHANLRGRMGWLNYLIGTAELHRWHHSVHAGEALNFGTVLPLWDQVFGTFRYRPNEQVAEVGLAPGSPQPASLHLAALLCHPFPCGRGAASLR